jgi:hypothetical protein
VNTEITERIEISSGRGSVRRKGTATESASTCQIANALAAGNLTKLAPLRSRLGGTERHSASEPHLVDDGFKC